MEMSEQPPPLYLILSLYLLYHYINFMSSQFFPKRATLCRIFYKIIYIQKNLDIRINTSYNIYIELKRGVFMAKYIYPAVFQPEGKQFCIT